jgi:uncharacterized coiled-coil protein SlyX
LLSRLRCAVQNWIGVADLHRILTRLEHDMATAAEQLDTLSAKFDDMAADVRAVFEERKNLSEDGQAALDRLAAKVNAFDTEVGDADGSDNPPPPDDTV